jgi:signal peptidase II
MVRFFYVTAGILILDQLSKLLVRQLDSAITLIPGFLSINLVMNTGAGFGLFQGQRWLLTWISVMVVGLILYYYDRIPERERIPFALILGGALGNLIDRLLLGYVVDFIDLSFWPAFNIADSALTIGVALLLLQSIRKK